MAHEWITPNTKPMKTEVMALSLELRQLPSQVPGDFFNEVQTRALLAGLSAVYGEVFIWTTSRNIGVWVTGTNDDLMVHAFDHFLSLLKNSSVVKGQKALSLFDDIIAGAAWSKVDAVEKFDQLVYAKRMALEAGSLLATLGSMVSNGLESLERQPLVAGLRNGWTIEDRNGVSKGVHVRDFPSVFFRYSLN
jgi:hypothetical protein